MLRRSDSSATRVSGYSQRMADLSTRVMATNVRQKLTLGITAVGIFLFFGATIAALAGTTLVFPGTILDRVWALNPTAYGQLAPVGRIAGMLFLLLSVSMAVAGTGWFRRRYWGWGLAALILAMQVLGDLVNVLRGDFVRGGIGFAIGGALLLYVLSVKVKLVFASRPVLND
jgi:hypothetical protein